ncbi:hypothetical protein FOMPIDRAFT_1048358 [Fomitopsis schrenkii]|uniref:DUF5648 domain-containing protein n=1 Tax=Fomitopsis schrenkii TaxID=2126942 RepID=S8EAZ5_FOMSC|nr:hypothetical protein FOMPIDRAFT_1048358 [Fomitopsis schrenkii]
MNNTIVNSCNTFEGTMGLVFRSPTVSATLLYRVYNAPQADHFYTTSQDEAVDAIRMFGYYNAAIIDHFYTTDETEREYAIAHVGIACYVLPDL